VKLGLDIAEVFEPLLKPARYKGAHGGRRQSLRVVCIRKQLQDLKENAKLLIEDELQEFGVSSR
jgi:phage terminase large subunit